ncbi:MAG: small basic protein [Victivallales bacterium]|jgi:small basic protein (TIGR04137 family)|nr:small basic protein [Victivallales bacterium]MBR4518804.1 small basic protein [Victivallales bacterium]MBR6471105.1 small basic protein [Victivallales bacterium]
MSVHPSLRTKGAVSEKRNVLKRHERVDKLKKEGRFHDGDKPWGLPKTKPED